MLPSQVFVFALTSISLAQFHFSTLVLTQLTLCPCLTTTSPRVKGYVCVSFGSCRFSMSDFSVKQKNCRCLQKKKMGYVRPSQSLFMLFIFCPWLCLSVCLCLPVSVYLPPPPPPPPPPTSSLSFTVLNDSNSTRSDSGTMVTLTVLSIISSTASHWFHKILSQAIGPA